MTIKFGEGKHGDEAENERWRTNDRIAWRAYAAAAIPAVLASQARPGETVDNWHITVCDVADRLLQEERKRR